MKIFTNLLIIFLCFSNTTEGYSNQKVYSDSITVDTFGGTYNGPVVDVPVFITGNGIVYSIDFSFRFDESRLNLDTVISLTPGLQYLYYINPIDSVFRFTSNSLSPVAPAIPFVLLRFTTSSYQICDFDIYRRESWLNGDPSVLSSNGCLTSGLNNFAPSQTGISIFPNPVSEKLFVNHSGIAHGEILNMAGRVLKKTTTPGYFDVASLPRGSYMLRITGDDFISIRKFVIAR